MSKTNSLCSGWQKIEISSSSLLTAKKKQSSSWKKRDQMEKFVLPQKRNFFNLKAQKIKCKSLLITLLKTKCFQNKKITNLC
jgi:hypothetical protein